MTKAIYKIKYLFGGLLIDLEGESVTNMVGSRASGRHGKRGQGGTKGRRKGEEACSGLWKTQSPLPMAHLSSKTTPLIPT